MGLFPEELNPPVVLLGLCTLLIHQLKVFDPRLIVIREGLVDLPCEDVGPTGEPIEPEDQVDVQVSEGHGIRPHSWS